jgi:hypothetical protein
MDERSNPVGGEANGFMIQSSMGSPVISLGMEQRECTSMAQPSSTKRVSSTIRGDMGGRAPFMWWPEPLYNKKKSVNFLRSKRDVFFSRRTNRIIVGVGTKATAELETTATRKRSNAHTCPIS